MDNATVEYNGVIPYASSGQWTSNNLLHNKDASNIDNFIYTLSSKPAGTGATVQFSRDKVNWYNSTGILNGTDTLIQGTNMIDLTALNWVGPSFYYKIVFTSDGLGTPVLDSVSMGEINFCSLDHSFSGYAWSSNIGWISISCNDLNDVNYGVNVESNGNLNGYAWSSHIGWIDFGYFHRNTGGVGASLNSITGEIDGDVLALSGLVYSGIKEDGWDGKISLSGLTVDGGSYQVAVSTININEVEGWAWGDDVIGWISFNCRDRNICIQSNYKVIYNPISLSFWANRGLTKEDGIIYNESIELFWKTNGLANTCSISWLDELNNTGNMNLGSRVGFPIQDSQIFDNIVSNTAYTLTCKDNDGTEIVSNLTIFVKSPPNILSFTGESTGVTPGSSILVAPNTPVTLRWEVQNTTSCSAYPINNINNWQKPINNPKTIPIGSEITEELTSPHNLFTIHCINDDYPAGIKRTVNVDVEQLELELRVTPNPVPFGQRVQVEWSVKHADSCIATNNVSENTLSGFRNLILSFSFGTHTWTSEPLIESEREHTITVECTGLGSTIKRTIKINTTDNPWFEET